MNRITYKFFYIILISIIGATSCTPPDFIDYITGNEKKPEVISTIPVDNSIDIDRDAYIILTFNQSMSINTVVDNLYLYEDGNHNMAVEYGYTWSEQNKKLLIRPIQLLKYDQLYVVRLERKAASERYIQLEKDFQFSFITVKCSLGSQSPLITRILPYNSEINVHGNRNVYITFSKEMDNQSAQDAFQLTDINNNEVKGSFSWEDNLMVFTPENELFAFCEYNIDIDTTAHDLSGLYLEEPINSVFKVHGEIEVVKTLGLNDNSLKYLKDIAVHYYNNESFFL